MPELAQSKPVAKKPEPANEALEALLKDLKPELAERLRSLEAFRQASEPVAKKIIAALPGGTAEELDYLRPILKEKNFLKLSPEDQSTLIDLVSGSPARVAGVAALLAKDNAKGEPLLTGERDARGRSLLANLTELRSAKPHADIQAEYAGRKDLDRVLVDVMMEIATPVHMIDQGNRGACAAASIQEVLCRRQPAEYVRLVTGLLVDRSVDARRGKLTVVEGSYAVPRADETGSIDLRSLPERLFQSAILNEGQEVGSYSYGKDKQKIGWIELPGGLSTGGVNRMLNLLFGRERFENVEGDAAKIHERLKASEHPAVVSMKWDKGNHAIVYVRSDDKFVYLKNPQGFDEEPESERKPPRANVEPGLSANTKMTIADFRANLVAASIERDGAPPPDLLQVAVRATAAIPKQAEAEVKKLAVAAPAVVTAVKQQVEQEFKKAETVVDEVVRFGALRLPPPPDPVQLFNQAFGPKK